MFGLLIETKKMREKSVWRWKCAVFGNAELWWDRDECDLSGSIQCFLCRAASKPAFIWTFPQALVTLHASKMAAAAAAAVLFWGGSTWLHEEDEVSAVFRTDRWIWIIMLKHPGEKSETWWLKNELRVPVFAGVTLTAATRPSEEKLAFLNSCKPQKL